MYAEIKGKNKILINRLDNNERIILENIVESIDKSDIDIKALTGETGDFDGIMITLNPTEEVSSESVKSTEPDKAKE